MSNVRVSGEGDIGKFGKYIINSKLLLLPLLRSPEAWRGLNQTGGPWPIAVSIRLRHASHIEPLMILRFHPITALAPAGQAGWLRGKDST